MVICFIVMLFFWGECKWKVSFFTRLYPPWNQYIPWKLMVGRWNFFLRWSLFRGHLFIFRAVVITRTPELPRCPRIITSFRSILAMKNLTRAAGCLGYLGDEILSSCMGSITNHYIQGSLLKTSMMESKRIFSWLDVYSFCCLKYV